MMKRVREQKYVDNKSIRVSYDLLKIIIDR